MTAQPPDPKTLESWEDAFQYPLPVVRKLEQQLRRNIDDNRQKLRSLVGASYRDLLGTAERIIDMDDQIHHVESQMTDIGRRCNTRNLEQISENHRRVRREMGKSESDRLQMIAQTKVLQNAINVSSRVVKNSGNALVAAKVLILARLLHKSLAESEEPPAVLETLQKKLGSSRKRLLGYIARALSRSNLDRSATVDTLSAYALLSASAPQDVLRYFLQLRFEQLETTGEAATESSIIDMLALYSQTLSETKDLFPRRFSEALSQVTTNALVRDPDVRAIYELSLDVYERWITENVRNFHPWVRHDQLQAASVSAAISSWARQGQECLLQTLQTALADQEDIHKVLQLRQKVISKYLVLSARLRHDSQTQGLNDIRNAFLERLEMLVEQASAVKQGVPDAQTDTSTSSSMSMWAAATTEMDVNWEVMHFRRDVLNRHHGRTKVMHDSAAVLDEWLLRLRDHGKAIAGMRSTKWDNDVDLDLDDLMEDEPLQVMLSTRDPQQLERKLHDATSVSLQNMFTTIEKSFESDTDPALLIRLLREVEDRRRGLTDLVEDVESIKPNRAFIAALHQQIATTIIADHVDRFTKGLQRPLRVATTLWDGTPPLPVQPSPTTFGLLKNLHEDMSTFGKDIWSPAAVQTLKKCLTESLRNKLNLSEIDESIGSPLTNGHARQEQSAGETDSGGSEDLTPRSKSKDRLMQLVFDVQYLQRVLYVGTGEDDRLGKVVQELEGRTDLELDARERLEKSANDYWRRTCLLFGLLASAG
ncbi:hypothetical protein CERZMDRAFT_39609 [Cercospora zeae-maydis SCOH1-5]|uniref:Conserved oligomeric Golgi complex subunit 1 n=1 Tax=Cercospora zeae-maydis SCOH1-5 TaxID=717836 RepID=A0A6A6FHZ6_9PEZI|nr:hypothetical protein CERZMDRAFT_39609 [Cercospora zeae-maydis SCOH1-5]